MTRRSARPLAAALAAVLWTAAASAEPLPAAAAADPRCDPQVVEALAGSARAGVEADLAIIRHHGQGIRDPDSILDFSCVHDLFDYRAFDLLFDPAGALEDILDLARRRICATARDAYRRYVGRTLDPSLYARPVRRLPGLDTDWRRRDLIGDPEAGGTDGALFRGVVDGGR